MNLTKVVDCVYPQHEKTIKKPFAVLGISVRSFRNAQKLMCLVL